VGRHGSQFHDTACGFRAKRRGFARDACLAQAFNMSDSSIERVHKLTQGVYNLIRICVRHSAPIHYSIRG
jgi:hypothetical protein